MARNRDRHRRCLPKVLGPLLATAILNLSSVRLLGREGLQVSSLAFFRFRKEPEPWLSWNGSLLGLTFEGGSGESPAYEVHMIEMRSLPKKRVGVNLVKDQRRVSRVLYPSSFNDGWRVGDDVIEVNGHAVATNEEVRAAVEKAVDDYSKLGTTLKFKVRRFTYGMHTRGMVVLTNKEGKLDHVVPMVDLTRGVLSDFPVVLLMEGSIDHPSSRSSRLAVKLLDEERIGFKAIDCLDDKANPGLRTIVREITGEKALPQLFVGGKHLGDLRRIQLLQESGDLKKMVQNSGGMVFLDTDDAEENPETLSASDGQSLDHGSWLESRITVAAVAVVAVAVASVASVAVVV
eukprot:TRINITY_DN1513_c1_g4_i1.p1 TRINITY_DN1513_c1_g4~~TRINITY_DN1513_c1_g4_i1.p1  ORF type:complete len:347 (-),score=73.01 TRINITY_DN1513_c1_g4_i1:48-1088(-)